MIDSHVHFWDPARLEYPWLESVPSLRRSFLPADYMREAPEVARAVFVECNCLPSQASEELSFVAALASQGAPVAGVVAFADLTDRATLAETLDALERSPLVKGVRHNIQGQPSGFCLTPPFIDGVREVGARGFTFDLCVTADQVSDAVGLVSQVRDTRFVLDHCGKPAIRNGYREPWRRHLARLAAQPNVVACKLSGLLTEAGPSWSDATLSPFLETTLECFGTERLMYGSDWPVVTLAGGHDAWFGVTQRFTARWTDEARGAFYHANAERVYRL